MNRIQPPSLAKWMIEHWMPSKRNQEIAGDLAEEFLAGRSAGWYWWQVLTAVTIGWLRELGAHALLILAAALWALLQPGWWLEVAQFESHSNLIGYVWRIPWP